MSDSVRPHRWQPTRLGHPWDSPGKNTGVGCHFLLRCMKVKSEREVAHLCPTLRDPMDCSLPGSSIHGIFQASVLEWVAIAFSASIHYPVVKKLLANARDIRDVGFILWLGRFPGGGHSNPFQYYCLERTMDKGVWQTTVQRVIKIWTQLKQLSMHTCI